MRSDPDRASVASNLRPLRNDDDSPNGQGSQPIRARRTRASGCRALSIAPGASLKRTTPLGRTAGSAARRPSNALPAL